MSLHYADDFVNLYHDGSRRLLKEFPEDSFDSCVTDPPYELGFILITPPDGIIFDPFAGSGSTLLAAKRGNFYSVGIELHGAHCEIAAARLKNS